MPLCASSAALVLLLLSVPLPAAAQEHDCASVEGDDVHVRANRCAPGVRPSSCARVHLDAGVAKLQDACTVVLHAPAPVVGGDGGACAHVAPAAPEPAASLRSSCFDPLNGACADAEWGADLGVASVGGRDGCEVAATLHAAPGSVPLSTSPCLGNEGVVTVDLYECGLAGACMDEETDLVVVWMPDSCTIVVLP